MCGCTKVEPLNITCFNNAFEAPYLFEIDPGQPRFEFGREGYMTDWCGNSGDRTIRIKCVITVSDDAVSIVSPPHSYGETLTFPEARISLNRKTGEGFMAYEGKRHMTFSGCKPSENAF